MRSRTLEAGFLVVMALAILVGGNALLVQIAQFRGIAVSVLATLALVVVYAFRQSYRRGGRFARVHAARDTAFLAAIAGAIAFTLAPARWSLGATIVALEIALAVELITCLAGPAPSTPPSPATIVVPKEPPTA